MGSPMILEWIGNLKTRVATNETNIATNTEAINTNKGLFDTHTADNTRHWTTADREAFTRVTHFRGYYITKAALETAYPTANDGDYAVVGATDTVWVWDSDNNEWKNTATQGNVISVNGNTGEVIISKTDLGLGNVDNTSDANKPVSTPQQIALDAKVNKKVVTTAEVDGTTLKAGIYEYNETRTILNYTDNNWTIIIGEHNGIGASQLWITSKGDIIVSTGGGGTGPEKPKLFVRRLIAITANDNLWGDFHEVLTDLSIEDLQNQVNTNTVNIGLKANANDVYTKSQIDESQGSQNTNILKNTTDINKITSSYDRINGTLNGESLIITPTIDNSKVTITPLGNVDYTYGEGEGNIIKLVTGSNRIVIKNGEDTQLYSLPINLGNLWLGSLLDKTNPDRILGETNNWYIRKNIKKITWNGTESWYIDSNYTRTDTIVFYMVPTNASIVNTDKIFASNFASVNVLEDDIEGIYQYNQKLYLSILKTKLDTEDVAGLEGYLNINNEDVYYLGDYSDIPISDTDLISQLNSMYNVITYAGTMVFTTNDTTTSAKMLLKVDAANSTVSQLKQRMDENNVGARPVTSVNNKTGAVIISKSDIGLPQVDNTADIDKEVKDATKLHTTRLIDGVEFDGTKNIIHYGVCYSAANADVKVVACDGFTLVIGAWISVTFTNTNTINAGYIYLNVNGTGSKQILYRSNGTMPNADVFKAGGTYLFVYDGTYFQLVGDFNQTIITEKKLNYGPYTNIYPILLGTADRTSDGTDTETLFMPIERVAIGHDGSILATGGITFDTIDPSNGNNTGIFYDDYNHKIIFRINGVDKAYLDANGWG